MKAKTLTLLLSIPLYLTFILPVSGQIATYQKTYGGSNYDIGNCLQPTADSGFIIAGQTKSFGDTMGDTYIIKVDKYGAPEMTKTYGGAWLDGGNSICTTGDGYFLTDHTTSFGAGECDSYVFKIDLSGQMQWHHTFGFTRNDAGYNGIQTTNGDYIITGLAEPPSDTDGVPFIARYAADGTPLWNQLYQPGEGYRIVQTPDGNFVIAGVTSLNSNGPEDMLIFKINGSGQVLWSKTMGGNGYEEPYGLINTSDGNLLIAGYTSSFGVGWSAYMLKLTTDGDSIWEHPYGSSGNDRAYGVAEAKDGYVFAGQTESPAGDLDVMVAKTDKAGKQLWMKSYGGAKDEYVRWIAPCADGGFGLVGTTQSFGAGDNDLYLIKIDADGETPTAINEVVEEQTSVEIFPNPAHASFTVKTSNLQTSAFFSLVDVTGKVNQNMALTTSSTQVCVDRLSAGIYFYSVTDAGGKVLNRGKLMVE